MLLLLTFACSPTTVAPTPLPPNPPSNPRPWPGSPTWKEAESWAVDEWVEPQLAEGESLAHPVFEGPLGPQTNVLFVVTKNSADPPKAAFAGFILFPGEPPPKRVDLPRLAEMWMPEEVPAVMFEDVDKDGQDEAIVFATYITGMGPEGVIPFNSNAVLDFDGTTVKHLPEVEAKIDTLDTAEKVRAVLK